ncbi:ABC transporter permease [Gracilibacillus halophilus YIM-C55.5]|uniref:ABC transporter permease n=1 Tax=Gracilibacillus halophilus YIM-C55.5 TaxID=1308866 RepID=N4WB20_9BACI|nr:ABC transporter permease [Gracilibacillus halophilus]ENH96454.1 ABC transporter permease [Gracilibacillus halophilus YIM-C55.5]
MFDGFFISLFGALESGIIYALMALGVYLTFRILDFPDLTVDGSFVTGGGVAAISIVNGVPPVFATCFAILAGFLAGIVTGILNTKGKINPLLSGILMMIALYSLNLRIMGKPNVALLNESTVFNQVEGFWGNLGIDQALNSILTWLGLESVPSTWAVLIIMTIVTFCIKFITDYFLKTEVGLALRATGDNEKMIRSFSANTDTLTILGVGISNAFVALSGALVSQYTGFADVSMGIGMIVIGLASVIIGEALIGTKTIFRTTLAVIIGAVLYRIVVTFALRADFLETGDMKLITALLVIIALIAPKIIISQREARRKRRKQAELARRKGANNA